MAFNVRIFGYRGVVQIEQRHPKQYTADTVFLLDDPYEWSQVLSVPEGTGAAVSSAVQAAPDLATVLYIQCPAGKSVRYEVNPQGPNASTSRVAGNASPMLSGWAQVPYSKGMTLSFADAAFTP